MFEQTMNSFKLEVRINSAGREEAVKTMRKLPVFGYTNAG